MVFGHYNWDPKAEHDMAADPNQITLPVGPRIGSADRAKRY